MDEELVEKAIEAFYKIRDMGELSKLPSTSELLDWIKALKVSGVNVERIGEEIPYVGVLLKKDQDILAVLLGHAGCHFRAGVESFKACPVVRRQGSAHAYGHGRRRPGCIRIIQPQGSL